MSRNRVCKRSITSGLLAVMLVATLIFGSWSMSEVEAAAKPKLSKTSIVMYPGQKTTLKVKNAKGKVAWSSSNKKVATVNNKGTIKALKTGNCNIYARVRGKKLRCKVTVVTRYQYDGMKLYSLVRSKGKKGSEGAREITLNVNNDDIEIYKKITISALPKKYKMEFLYEYNSNEEWGRTGISMDVFRDKRGKLKCHWENGSCYPTTVTGTIGRDYNGKLKGLNLIRSEEEYNEEPEPPYIGAPRSWEKKIVSRYVRDNFRLSDKLLKKYGYSMKKLGFNKY